MYLSYSSRLGSLGNFWFGMKRVKNLIGSQVKTIGWFRRGMASRMDLIQLETKDGTRVKSFPRFWLLVSAVGLIVLGVWFMFLASWLENAQ